MHLEVPLLLVPMPSLRVKACMLAKMIKSSSPLVNLRTLLRLNSTVSSLNSLEQGPPFEPREHPQPSCRNFLAVLITALGVSSLSLLLVSAIVCHFRVMHASRENKYTSNRASLVVMEIMHLCADFAWDLGTVFLFIHSHSLCLCGEERCVTIQK